MGFGSGGNDIEVKVRLETNEATQQAQKLKTDTENALKGIANAASSPGSALKDLARNFSSTNAAASGVASSVGGLASKLAPLAPAAIAVTAAVAGLTLGFKALIGIAADGDKFGDIADAFEDKAAKAGVLADELRGNLSKAFLDTLDSATLMAEANKAFALGIDPKVFDDMAAAAKRYADATGGDAKAALSELISGVNTGREALLRKFGVVKDGVLVLDAFTDSVYENGQANRNVTDVYEQFTASLTNTYNEVARAINESELLKVTLQALTSIVAYLAEVVGGAITAFIEFTNKAVRFARAEIEKLSLGLSAVGELFAQLGRGEMPSLSKAMGVVVKQMGEAARQTDKTEKVLVKLNKTTDSVAKSTKKLGDPIGEAVEALKQFEKTINDTLGVEDFQLDPQVKILRDKVRSAFEFGAGDKAKILKALKENVIGPYLKEVENLPEETKKRLAELSEAIQKVNAEQKSAGAGSSGKNGDGEALLKFLGFDPNSVDFGDLAGEMQSALNGAFSTALNGLANAAINGDGRAAAQAAGAAIGTVIGAAIGAYFGAPAAGAAVGGTAGGFLGGLVKDLFGDDNAGTKARKEADKFFADVFDENRLSAIVGGKIERIRDLVFNGTNRGFSGEQGYAGGAAGNFAGPIGTAIGIGIGGIGGSNPGFNGETFAQSFEQLPPRAQAAFQAVGVSMEEFLGLSDDISGQIGSILVNNIGGNIENLQVLVQTLGKSFEELGGKLFEAFFDGTLSLEQLQANLQGLNEVFTAGLPGIGQVEEAVRNFQIALADGKGSRILFDSLRDIGAEAGEVGSSFEQMAGRVAAALGLGADRVNALLEAMKIAGIKSIEDLVNASNAQLAALALNIKDVVAGKTPGAAPVADPTAGVTPPSNFAPGSRTPTSSSGGGGGGGGRSGGGGGGASEEKRKAEEAKRKREQEFQQIYRLLSASKAYEDILDKITNKEIQRRDANKDIARLFDEISKAQKALTSAEKDYQEALKKGGKKELVDLAEKLDKARDKLDKLTETSKEAQKNLKFDLSKVTPLVGTLNQLGVISRAVGISLDGVTNTLVAGFLRGKKSLAEFNDELKKSEQILGKGIPDQVGAVESAFNNLIEGGLKGGIFSTDAFRDIFTEFNERFKKQSSESRKVQESQLTREFDEANRALQDAINGGVGPGGLADLRAQAEGAKKALDDFRATPIKAGFEDLRSELKKTYSPQQIDTFFEALRNSGITNLDDFENANNDTVTKILADLQKLGFGFGETTDRVKDILKETDKAITDANGGKDVLQASLDAITKFNTAVESLGSDAGPLASLAAGFDDILERMGQLGDKTFENDVIFNIKTNGSSGERALLEVLFGDGSGTSDAPGGAPGNGPGLSPEQRRRFEELRRKRTKGRLTPGERREFEDLRRSRRA